MIKMDGYLSGFEEEYGKAVDDVICKSTQEQIVKSCKKFLPDGFFDSEKPPFQELVQASFAKLKKAKKHIQDDPQSKMKAECFDPKCQNKSDINDLYIQIYEAFEHVMKKQKNKMSMRVRIVKETDFTVCPYCNRDYINCRADNVSGAQLDHFFSRSEYPIFAVSLYNLVPVCANCNRIKSLQPKEFASPFDETIDWENEIKFVYRPESLDSIKIDIKSENQAVKNNIDGMRIKETYQIHDREVLEIQYKQQAYSESQRKEIQEVLQGMEVSDEEIKRVIFGPEITLKDMRKKPLGKMMSDFHKELKIY